MLGKVASFEFRYQLRQPAFWVITILFTLISFGAVALSSNISVGGGGAVHVNSPFTISVLQGGLNQLYMLAAAAIVANVIVRDFTTGYGPLIFSTPISKSSYLFGRFIGAFGAMLLTLIFAQFGHIIGTFMPPSMVDPETVGAFNLASYVWAFLVMGVPGLFFLSALFFALATITRSMMMTYVAVVAVFILYLVATTILGMRPEFETLTAWVEPTGLSAYQLATKYWTTAERNAGNPSLEGVLLWGRVLWIAIGVGFLGLAYALFERSSRGAKASKKERIRTLVEAPVAVASIGPLARPTYGFAAAWTQLVSLTRFEMSLVFKSVAYLVLVTLALGFSIMVIALTGELYGTPLVLVTRIAIAALSSGFALVSVIIAIYYSGELVWRDRDRRMHEIVDATSTPDWTFLFPKILALVLVLVSTLLIGVIAGVIVQTFRGVTDYELGKYLAWYVAPQAVNFALLAVLAIVVQSLSPNKFVGWAIMVVYMISNIVLRQIGLDHILYRYGSGIGVPLSDMNGRGDFAGFAAWTDAYWTAFAVILLIISYGLWRRGTETRLMPRLKRFPRRLKGPAGVIAALALVAFIGLGSFIFVNTNVWNTYRSQDAGRLLQANYEKTLLHYEDQPQPSVVDLKLQLDLEPHAPRLVTRGQYVIENKTGAPLNEIHFRWPEDIEMEELTVQGATQAREWKEFDYRIYRFATPMQPGERRTVNFRTVFEQKGFKVSGNTTRVVDNGTFITNREFTPTIGMGREGLLTDRGQRRKHGLPAELRPAKLEDASAQSANYLGADWVTADITVTTDADQTVVAPGLKVSDQVADGRRTARFVTESPVLNFFSVQSARYAQSRRMHNGVELVVFHDPAHTRNVPRMLDALASSLDYFQANFSPYQFRQARIVEFPDYASYAQSFPNTFAWSEGLGFIADLSDPTKVDYVTYVAAHEFGHQWWAHQIIGSNQQGMTSLSETLAQYSALMVMEKTYGRDQIRRFLKFELDRYLRARGTERLEELPLMRNENQQYIHYQKGGLVMYLLREEIGEEAVNRALRRLLAQYAFKSAPYPRSLDLVAALRAEAPADKQALITDLFEKITLYDVKTTAATATKRADGRWDVVVTVDARKLYADGEGEETVAPLNETFDVGLFSAEPGKGRFGENDVILMERRPIRSGVQTLRFITTRKPAFAGVDPYNKWIDRNSDDNLRKLD
ncbi:ABC transporter permease/M1 family aminopeptidase [Brevundimonas lenta]|uniref:Aminopeptidase N n=1 Tax=Brevundimonas lenta TaxID=424796 RepID=A0A7W6NQK6_9CAUL|nr:M1 family aminopeptidase [Brevundimonas lenta]MBB4084018.1 aminopeptidase N [Brevundimonas lenta]